MYLRNIGNEVWDEIVKTQKMKEKQGKQLYTMILSHDFF